MTQTNQMRRGFTMIELIFVIVIIGILAAVAIPKLAQNRDDATASVCASEYGNILSSITNKYSQEGYTKFQDVTLNELFNGNFGVTDGDGKSGVKETSDTAIKNLTDSTITYNCEGASAATIKFTHNGEKYDITLDTSDANASNVPATIKAGKVIEEAQKIDPSTHTKTIEL